MSSKQTIQLAALLLADPADNDFMQKIYPSYYDIGKTLVKDTPLLLSEAILLLLGFYPGPWLDWVPQNIHVGIKLHNEWLIFERAKNALRSRKLKGILEGTLYYVQPTILAKWFQREKISIHESVAKYLPQHKLSSKNGKKRGAKEKRPDIVHTLGNYFKSQDLSKISKDVLETTDDQEIQSLIQEFITTSKGDPKRRKKKLQEKINAWLKIHF